MPSQRASALPSTHQPSAVSRSAAGSRASRCQWPKRTVRAATSMSRRWSSRNAQPLALLRGQVDLERQVERGGHVAEHQARAFGGGIAAHPFAKPQLADVDVERDIPIRDRPRTAWGSPRREAPAPPQANASSAAMTIEVRLPHMGESRPGALRLAQDGAGGGEHDRPHQGKSIYSTVTGPVASAAKRASMGSSHGGPGDFGVERNAAAARDRLHRNAALGHAHFAERLSSSRGG